MIRVVSACFYIPLTLNPILLDFTPPSANNKTYEIKDSKSAQAVLNTIECLSTPVSNEDAEPTPKQIWCVAQICDKCDIERPANYETDKRVCWRFINKHKDKLN